MELTELIESIDILEFLSQFMDFEEKNGEYWGLSPLKEENTPSFSVRRETNSFYDFSSGVGGNVLTFVRHYYKCGYEEAISKLKEYVGFDGEFVAKKKLAVVEVAKRFSKPKKSNKVCKSVVLPSDYMNRYEKDWDKLRIWEQEGISRESLNKYQVFYDSFSDRIVYPIRDVDGNIVNIGGRTLDKQWKEKGMRKYTYFQKWGELKTIYGLAENRKDILDRHEIIIFEGCKSVLLADTWGIHNCGAILTSHLNPNQMKELIKLGCNVVFALDSDVDVREDHNIKRLKQFVNVSYIWDRNSLLDLKDAPVDKGVEVFKKLYSERIQLK